MKVREILEAVKPVWKPNKNYSDTNPNVTVILPTFRRAKSGFFEKAVESVLNQTYTSWELIIVDDASTDGTEALINFYMELDNRISTIRHTNNMGLPAISEYEGYMKARGEYIAFIFDDNEWESCHLMSSVKKMIKENVKITFGRSNLYYSEQNFVTLGDDLAELPVTNFIGNGSVVVHRDIFETIGLYDPHLSLTRLCDWDMWYRISQDYIMSSLSTLATSEKGVLLNDSLGNTVDMNVWISLERMSYYRNKELLPKNYLDIDITEIKKDSTDLFVDFVNCAYNKHKKKCWYRESIISKTVQERRKMRVLIVSHVDATYYLGFEKLREYAIIKVSNDIYDTAYADVIIFIRNLNFAYTRLREMKKIYKEIPPSYLYMDDNYFVLCDEDNDEVNENDKKDAEIMVSYLKRDKLIDYKGIVVTSTDLQKYMIDKNIHDEISYLPQVTDDNEIVGLTPIEDTLNIAFMGGSFREKIFVDKVFPAIIELSKKTSVKVVSTERLISKINENYQVSDSVTLVSLPLNYCYTQFVQYFKKENIHILIHSGIELSNNRYKTKNALMNAVKIGAILITSDVEPYNNTDAIVNSNNKTDDWYKVLSKFASDEKERKVQYERQCSYIREYHSKKLAGNIFISLIKKNPNISSLQINERLMALMRWIDKNNSHTDLLVPEPAANAATIWNPDNLIFSGNIADRKKYFIWSTVPQINKLGVIFTSLSEQKASGMVICRITDKKHKNIGISRVNIDKIVYNNWTYFPFVNIELPTEFYLEFEFNYESDNVYLGIYENISNRSLRYRIANKLKLPYYGVNVPLIDLSNLN